MKSKGTAKRILDALARKYPKEHRPWANRSQPYRTLIGTILSAQTTDDQVDRVTPTLFGNYPTLSKLALAKRRDVARTIKPIGLHQAKSKNVIAASRMIVEKFGGKVPQGRNQLIGLPGVGRKTANVVLIKAFGRPAMPVDTHVFRVANRIGLAKARTPKMVEAQLEEIIPKQKLAAAHFYLIHHGRTICTARRPLCSQCPVAKNCDYVRIRKKN